MGKKNMRKYQYISIEQIKEVLKPHYKRVLESNADNLFLEDEFLFDAFENLYKEIYEQLNDLAVVSLKKYLAFEVYPYIVNGNQLKYNFNWRTFSDKSLIEEYKKQGMYSINLEENKICLIDDSKKENKEDKYRIKTHTTLDFKEHRHLCPKYNIEKNTKSRISYIACEDCLLKTNNKKIGYGLECNISVFMEG